MGVGGAGHGASPPPPGLTGPVLADVVGDALPVVVVLLDRLEQQKHLLEGPAPRGDTEKAGVGAGSGLALGSLSADKVPAREPGGEVPRRVRLGAQAEVGQPPRLVAEGPAVCARHAASVPRLAQGRGHVPAQARRVALVRALLALLHPRGPPRRHRVPDLVGRGGLEVQDAPEGRGAVARSARAARRRARAVQQAASLPRRRRPCAVVDQPPALQELEDAQERRGVRPGPRPPTGRRVGQALPRGRLPPRLQHGPPALPVQLGRLPGARPGEEVRERRPLDLVHRARAEPRGGRGGQVGPGRGPGPLGVPLQGRPRRQRLAPVRQALCPPRPLLRLEGVQRLALQRGLAQGAARDAVALLEGGLLQGADLDGVVHGLVRLVVVLVAVVVLPLLPLLPLLLGLPRRAGPRAPRPVERLRLVPVPPVLQTPEQVLEVRLHVVGVQAEVRGRFLRVSEGWGVAVGPGARFPDACRIFLHQHQIFGQ